MQKYILLSSLTTLGRRTLKERPARMKEVDDEIEEEDEYQEVRNWFKKVGFVKQDEMEKYCNLFIDDGFETLEDIADMDESDLESLGITKKGHIKKLMKAIAKLTRIN